MFDDDRFSILAIQIKYKNQRRYLSQSFDFCEELKSTRRAYRRVLLQLWLFYIVFFLFARENIKIEVQKEYTEADEHK